MSFVSRRNFLKYLGLGSLAVASAAAFSGCTPDDVPNIPGVNDSDNSGPKKYLPVMTPKGMNLMADTQCIAKVQDYTIFLTAGYRYTGDLKDNSAFAGLDTEHNDLLYFNITIGNDSSNTITLDRTFQFYEDGVSLDGKHCTDRIKVKRNGTDITTVNCLDSANSDSGNRYEPLQPGQMGSVIYYTLIPKGWDTLELTYSPSFASDSSVTFLVTSSDIIPLDNFNG